jgi:predicted RecA/RadA family phage recombinase
MINQVFTGTPTNSRFALCPASIVAGQPVLLGTIAAVALNSYSAATGGATFYLNGSFSLTVIGQSAESPQTTHQINPGDKLYATGTLDTSTNVTYNLTIDANSGNSEFGRFDPNNDGHIAAGATNTQAIVQLVTGA